MFGPLIRKYILDNQHRVDVTLLPDPKLAAQIEEEEKAKLKAKRSSMTPDQVGGSRLAAALAAVDPSLCYLGLSDMAGQEPPLDLSP